jgi:hypothetical protein
MTPSGIEPATLQCCDNLKYGRLMTENALLQNGVHRHDQMGIYSQNVTRVHSAPKGNSLYSNKNRMALPAPTLTTHKYSTQFHSYLEYPFTKIGPRMRNVRRDSFPRLFRLCLPLLRFWQNSPLFKDIVCRCFIPISIQGE